MKRKKILTIVLFSFLLVFAGSFFVGCGRPDYSKMSLISTVQGQEVSNVTLKKGDQTSIEFKIINYDSRMNGQLVITPTFDSAQCFKLQQNYKGDGVTSLVLTATQGGQAHIEATSQDGRLTRNITVVVTEFSTTLENASNNLYVTESSKLVPDSSDFVFSQGSNVRDLEYYFYGASSIDGGELTMQNLPKTADGNYLKFKSTTLIEQKEMFYLIFDDGEGHLKTIQHAVKDVYENVPMQFVDATLQEDGSYMFTGEALPVTLGDKFTFFAVQQTDEEPIYTTCDFYVLRDLSGEDIEYSYTHSQEFDAPVYPNENQADKGIYIIPNDSEHQKAYLTVTLPTDSERVKLELEKFQSLNLRQSPSEPIRADGKSIYNFELTSDSSTSINSDLSISMFYDGYEDEDDPNVNFKMSIPVHILHRPETILVNSISNDQSAEHVYTFYNEYATSNIGWQEFDVRVSPTDAEMTNFVVTFDPAQVMMKYRNQTYAAGTTASNQTSTDDGRIRVTLNELSQPLYFKGLWAGGRIGQGNIDLTLNYKILDQSSLTHTIYYNVVNGPTQIAPKEDDYVSDAVYLAYGKTQTFEGLYANADFSSLTVEFVQPDDEKNKDVVDIEFKGTVQGAQEDADKFFLSLSVSPKAIGRGLYRITLDNGTAIEVQFEVIENLDSLSAIGQGSDKNISYFINNSDGQSSTIYIKNENDASGPVFGSEATVSIFANGDQSSTAIWGMGAAPEADNKCFAYNYDITRGGNIVVHLTTQSQLGVGTITFQVQGFTVSSFKKVSKSLTYVVKVVSYGEIGGLDIYKTQDGYGTYDPQEPAGNVTVYCGTDLTNKKTAKFDVQPQFDGYLFFDPSTGSTAYSDMTKYVESEFDKRFISWTASETILNSRNIQVSNMVFVPGQENIYVLEGVGTFDTSSMTFVALNNEFSKVQLTATVMQFGIPISKSIILRAISYTDIDSIALQEPENNTFAFSALPDKQQKEFFLHVNPKNATEPSISAVFVSVPMANGKQVDLFGDNGISITEVGDEGVFRVVLTISKDFLADLVSQQDEKFECEILFASSSWIDGGTVAVERQPYCARITVKFTNGTKKAPYLLETPEDVLSMNDQPDKHYQISSTIDLGQLSDQQKAASLPIGKNNGAEGFTGSLVGTNQYAQIKGINITASTGNGNYYGLFSIIGESAIIEGVKFDGQMALDLSLGGASREKTIVYIGMIAGQNKGQLINIGVTLSADSSVSISGTINGDAIYVGGVVGLNYGLIIQDYGEYVPVKYSYTSQMGGGQIDVRGKYANQTPNILMYGGDFTLTVTGTNSNNETIYIGGIAGSNQTRSTTLTYDYGQNDQIRAEAEKSNTEIAFDSGSIVKIDNANLKLFGYSNYLSYLNIAAVGQNKKFVGGIAGSSSGPIFAWSGVKMSGDKIATPYTNNLYAPIGSTEAVRTPYQAGKGIVVGGSIVDRSYVVSTKSIESDDIIQNVGGIVGEINVDWGRFSGITARTSVLASKNVGIISGAYGMNLNSESEVSAPAPAFAIQAVNDGGKTGFYASMLARVSDSYIDPNDPSLADENSAQKKNWWIWWSNKSQDLDNVAFGFSEMTDPNTTIYVDFMKDNNVKSYSSRTLSHTFNANLDSDKYYGDVIIARGLEMLGDQDPLYSPLALQDGAKSQIGYMEFSKDRTGVSVDASEGFAGFTDKNGNATDNVFYMHYFRSQGYVFQDDDDFDISASQTYLDKNFNTLMPSQKLYPLSLGDGMTLSSLTPDILTIDQSGKITVMQTGIAKIKISSILDTGNSKQFYLYIVDYFNSNNNSSIIYPTNSSHSTPLNNNSVIEIKNEETTTLYVIPSSDTNEFADYGQTPISDGVLYSGGANIRLAANDSISVKMQVYVQGTETPTYDSEGDNSDSQINVDINGQTISIRRNQKTVEYSPDSGNGRYLIEANPILKVELDGKTYIAEVNKKLDKAQLHYRKGAKKIEVLRYSKVSMLTSQTIQETIRVTSSYADSEKDANGQPYEGVPYYEIYRGGKVVYGNYPDPQRVINAKSAEVFHVEFGKIDCKPANSTTNDNDIKYYYYIIPVTITFNLYSDAWENRNEPGNSIYGLYTIIFYAKSNTEKFTSIDINLERTVVGNISIDNYSSQSTLKDFSASSHIGVPGKSGLLRLTLTPQDSDFEYITIENDVLGDQAGNGNATFSLLALDKTQPTNPDGTFNFRQVPILGQVSARGVRYAMADIVAAYDEDKGLTPYNGIIYIRYNIGTRGVADKGAAKFNIFTESDGVRSPTYSISLQLKLEFHAYADIVGKTPIEGDDIQDIHATYYVARGMRYEISLDDIWGYTQDDVTLSVSDSTLATIEQENGKYYIQITDSPITYGSDGKYVNIQTVATQKVGEIDRRDVSNTRLRVLDYVVNYNFEQLGNADILDRMEDGIINVRVGNKQALAVDITDYIEFNTQNSDTLRRVNAFLADLSEHGEWTLYHNLLDGQSQSSGRTITTDDYAGTNEISPTDEFEDIYMYVDGLNIVPRRTHNPATPYYLFKYDGGFAIDATNGGIYAYNNTSSANKISTEFAFNVYQATSDNSPIPIDDYADFMDMQDGSDYILTDNIVIPNADDSVETPFAPISRAISSLDGNDYSIIFNGTYNFGDATVMALFGQVDEDTLLKNIRIELTGDTTFVTTSSQPFDAALLAGTNLGSITNCEIVGGEDSVTHKRFAFSVTSSNLQNQSYVAGLVTRNSGFVTNCRSSVYIKTTFNASGLVGINSRHIASSYFRGGRIEVQSPEHNMAGLVVINQTGATIMTSYVSGEVDPNYIFSRDTQSVLYSTSKEAGFAFTNEPNATISDCYSNIQITGTSSSAGFVFNNAGHITNSFSLSVVESQATTSAGFAMTDAVEGQAGVGDFKDCYYFTNTNADIDSHDGYSDIGEINVSLVPRTFVGVTPLNRRGFEKGTATQEAEEAGETDKSFANLFGSYATYDLTTANTNAVWFYVSANSRNADFGDHTFAPGRLELVSANVIARSRRNLSQERTTTQDNGEVDYQYDYDINYPALGTNTNPYIIRNAQSLESLMKEGATVSGFNYNSYRFVSDINYSDYGDASNLYKITFAGKLEGNGMTISNIILSSSARLEKAGLFAQIGRNVSNIGVVTNLKLSPIQDITFNNAQTVGGLAGVLDNGYLFNVSVADQSLAGGGNKLNIAGVNFVGGIVGRAENNYKIFNAYSNMSVVANYHPIKDVGSYEVNGDITANSYAGALVGYASGRGSIVGGSVENVDTIMGERVGLAFGGVGQNVVANDITVTPSATTSIKAYRYGAFVAGENRGKIDLAVVQNGGGAGYNPFALRPSVPVAVGGVVGYSEGGTISRAKVNQGFVTGSLILSDQRTTAKISSVGGIVGLVDGNRTTTLTQIVVEGAITAGDTLGGAVGRTNSTLNLDQIAIKGDLSLTGYNSISTLGGFVGSIESSRVAITDSYVWSNFAIETYVYSSQITANVGHFVGNGNVWEMARCYSKGSMTVTLTDNRSSIPMPQDPFASEDDFEENDVADKIGYKVTFSASNQQTNDFDNTTPDASAENAKIKDVYFFGSSTGKVFDSNASMGAISFRANSNMNFAFFNLNLIGTGSREMLNSMGTETINQENLETPDYALHNLFDYRMLDKEIEDKAISENIVTIYQELYYQPKLDRFYVISGQKVEIATGTFNVKYYEREEGGISYVPVCKEDTEKERKLNFEVALSEFKNMTKDNDSKLGHSNLSKIWLVTANDFSTLNFENMFDIWRA